MLPSRQPRVATTRPLHCQGAPRALTFPVSFGQDPLMGPGGTVLELFSQKHCAVFCGIFWGEVVLDFLTQSFMFANQALHCLSHGSSPPFSLSARCCPRHQEPCVPSHVVVGGQVSHATDSPQDPPMRCLWSRSLKMMLGSPEAP
jgi:hypothetical protein